MSKYGDDSVCTCEMELVTCKNDYHADHCELWAEESFKSGLDEWDGDMGCLVLAASPWEHADEFIWNGDEPVVRKSTQDERAETIAEVIAEWEQATVDTVPMKGYVSICEQEALDALCDGNKQDKYGMIALEDGSYADFDNRVTYRRIMTDGQPQWVEIFWDASSKQQAEMAESTALAKAEFWQACTCTPEHTYFCSKCKCQRDKDTDQWRYWAGHADTTPKSGANTSSWSWKSCHHVFETFELPGRQNRNIKISGKRFHTKETTPDFGLYAYGGWDPDCVATFIPWQDYGLPKVAFEKVAAAIVHAYTLAEEGMVVEVGCMGGHGRTGTILACLAILSKPEMSSKQAINHVRRVHCDEAIETNTQEWFVEWFRCWYNEEPCPERPTTYVSKHSANWNNASAAATATKNNEPTLPLASLADGTSTERKWTWCSGCKRTVNLYHNAGCPLGDSMPEAPKPLTFDPEAMKGETANARRRNAKRANRRKAQRARAAQRRAQANIVQEYV